MIWFSWFRKSVRKPAKAATAKPLDPPRHDPAPSQTQMEFLPWLMASTPLHRGDLSAQEVRALHAIQKTLALPALPQNLLPRASTLVPQLIALMRESTLPHRTISERVSKDPKLTAEVMRVANSPFYRAQQEITTLMQAIALIGSVGMQTAIARVVLKPILHTAATPALAAMEERLWEHSEFVAQHAAALAPSAGLEGVEGYVAGLLHNTGWKVALRTLEHEGIVLEASQSLAFASAMTDMAHRLFGLACKDWEITPGFTAFATEAHEFGLARTQHPLGSVLRTAQSIAMDEMTSGLSQTLPAPLL
jgi:HD-like signal output (HDOD) protein